MLDSEPTGAAGGATSQDPAPQAVESTPAEQNRTEAAPAKATRRRRTTKTAKAAAPAAETPADVEPPADVPAPAKRTRARKSAAKAQPAAAKADEPKPEAAEVPAEAQTTEPKPAGRASRAPAPPVVTFIAPPVAPAPAPASTESAEGTESEDRPAPAKQARKRTPSAAKAKADTTRAGTAKAGTAKAGTAKADTAKSDTAKSDTAKSDTARSDTDRNDTDGTADEDGDGTGRRRRRGRRGRGRGRPDEGGEQDTAENDESAEETATGEASEGAEDTGDGTTRRRRRRRRSGGGDESDSGESGDDEVKAVRGSTRLEAKRQRRRDGREQTRRRPPILSESEFLARREAVERTMVVRQRGERTQIAVLEDKVLVEHYVTKASSTSYAGNVYLGRVQNVLPSMEAAFVDIGKGRNAVLYAGEVNWDLAGLDGKARSIEQAMRSGDSVLVQVSKDPIGHKGARLTSQISLPGRYLVYVPGGAMTGISRKLPDTERTRLKGILRKIVPDDAGVIIRTAAEGASEEELTRDVNRLKAQWEVIEARAAKEKSSAPTLLYEEPDLAIRVVRDIFNEDFSELIISGDEVWETLQQYVEHVAPDLRERLHHHTGEADVFAAQHVDEQLAKGLDRKVWLPSGGSLVIDRTEAMTVIDVNTGKFTGQGGNLEETVTRNNLEAAEEIVRQLRLRDIGGIIVIDFIDMVLESNRDLVLRRLTECLGRDRTRHQVAEVTSLGLVQMTRKRVGQGLLEAFSEPCPHCNGRGVLVHSEPVDTTKSRSNGSEGNGKSRENDKRRDVAAASRKGRSGKASAAVAESPAAESPVAEPVVAEPVAAEPLVAEPAAAEATDLPAEAVEVPRASAPEPEPEPVPHPAPVSVLPAASNGAAPAVATDEPAEHATNGASRPRRGRRRAATREAGSPTA